MNIAFLSSYFHHHQKYVADELYRITGKRYHFIVKKSLSDSLIKVGYHEYENEGYLVQSSNGISTEAQNVIDEADVLIVGGQSEKWIHNRKKQGKVIIRYAERPLKKGIELWKYPVRFFRWHRENPKVLPIYMLCSSAFTSADYSKFFLFRNRAYKWGYFPECIRYDVDELFSRKEPTEILWCGRFIDWKHTDDTIRVAEKLKSEGYKFNLSIIGTGPMKDTLQAMISEFNLEDCVHLFDSMSPEEVRKHMEKAGIYLFTSDRQEGWGAVLNESMNSGCAVVASHAIGSVPFLMKNKENGLVYRSGDVDMLYRKTKYLLDNPCEQRRLGRKAYETIVTKWNAEVAASRLVQLSEAILNGEVSPDLFEDGPCSRAELIKDNWFYDEN